MREMLVRSKYVIACAIVLSVVLTADARDAAPVRSATGDGRPQITAADRDRRDLVLPRVIRRILKSLDDGLTIPHP
jgi:superfamily I DNA and RNA helicase